MICTRKHVLFTKEIWHGSPYQWQRALTNDGKGARQFKKFTVQSRPKSQLVSGLELFTSTVCATGWYHNRRHPPQTDCVEPIEQYPRWERRPPDRYVPWAQEQAQGSEQEVVSFPAPLPQKWLPPAKDGSGTFRRISWSCWLSITRILVGQSACSKILYYK